MLRVNVLAGSLVKFQISNHFGFEVIRWALRSGQISLKSVRRHVSPLPGPLMDTSWVRGCPLEKNSYARKF